MNCRFVLFSMAFVLIAVSAAAVPVPPSDVRAEMVGSSVKVSWQHSGGTGVSFNVYRGKSVEAVAVIGSVAENFFVDKGIVLGEEYVYLVTAVDASGESSALEYVSIKPLAPSEKPFSVTLVEPKEKTVDLETVQEIAFVLSIESKRFQDLVGLKAVLLNEQFGIREEFGFDSGKKLFTLSTKMPREQPTQALQTTYNIQVSAIVDGNQFSESMDVDITLVPKSRISLEGLVLPLIALCSALAIFGAVVVTIRKRWLQKKSELDKWLPELDEVRKQKDKLYRDLLRGNLTRWQWNEMEMERQRRELTLEKEIGIAKKGKERKVVPFEGFTVAEKDEVLRLVQAIGKPKEGETMEQLRTRLVHMGRNEKIAKKAAEMVFKRHEGEKQKKDEKRESDGQDKPEKTKQETAESEDGPEIKAEWQRTAEKEESEENKSGKSRN